MSGVNRITRTINQKSAFESAYSMVSSTSSWNQGDLLCLDTTNHVIKAVAAETDSANFLGIATQSIVNGVEVSPYGTAVAASRAITDLEGPIVGIIARVQLKSGDSLVPGSKVGISPTTNVFCVSSTITTQFVGVYAGPAITAGASTFVEIYFGNAYIASVAVA